jgi:hypothetical protein
MLSNRRLIDNKTNEGNTNGMMNPKATGSNYIRSTNLVELWSTVDVIRYDTSSTVLDQCFAECFLITQDSAHLNP